MNNEQINELIVKKIAAAEEIDSGWIVAWVMLQALPALQQIAKDLSAMRQVSTAWKSGLLRGED